MYYYNNYRNVVELLPNTLRGFSNSGLNTMNFPSSPTEQNCSPLVARAVTGAFPKSNISKYCVKKLNTQ